MESSISKVTSTVITSWVNEYGDALFKWANYKISNKEIAEDLVQETFLSAFQNKEKFRGESNPKTWLLTILNNKIIDHYRKSSKREILVQTKESENAFSMTETFFDEKDSWSSLGENTNWTSDTHLLDDEDFNNRLAECISNLPENWKKAISFKYIIDKEPKEICQELDISMSNYWQVIHRAKLLLKKCLEINYFKHV